MQKFKALFRRGQRERAVRGRHIEPEPSTSTAVAVDPAPFTETQSATASIVAGCDSNSGGGCSNAAKNQDFIVLTMDEKEQLEELRKLKLQVAKWEKMLAAMAVENDYLKTVIKKTVPEATGRPSSNEASSQEAIAGPSVDCTPQREKTSELKTASSKKQAPEVSSIFEDESLQKLLQRSSISDFLKDFTLGSRQSLSPPLAASSALSDDECFKKLGNDHRSSIPEHLKDLEDCISPSQTGASAINKEERLRKWLADQQETIPGMLRDLTFDMLSPPLAASSAASVVSESGEMQSSLQNSLSDTSTVVNDKKATKNVNSVSHISESTEETTKKDSSDSSAGIVTSLLNDTIENMSTWLYVKKDSPKKDQLDDAKENITTKDSSDSAKENITTKDSSDSSAGIVTSILNDTIENMSTWLYEKDTPEKDPLDNTVITVHSSSSEEGRTPIEKRLPKHVTSQKSLRDLAAEKLRSLPPEVKSNLIFPNSTGPVIDLDLTTEQDSTLEASNNEMEVTSIHVKQDTIELSSTADSSKNTEDCSQEVQLLTPEVSQLHDDLKRMQESHYSTNEELQATIQELSDLQNQLDQTKSETEKFREEKALLVESLCRQTERLEKAQEENDRLQTLLKKESSFSDRSVPDREQKLIELLKQGQTKREEIISQNIELMQKLNEIQRAKEMLEDENKSLAERVRELEITVEDIQFEKRTIEDELVALKEEQSSKHFEMLRLNVLLDIEEQKVDELQAAQASLGNENELYNMMNNVLKEKEFVEKKLADSEDALKRSNCENLKLKQDINSLQEQLITLKETAENAVYELENYSKRTKAEQKDSARRLKDLKQNMEDMEQKQHVLERELQSALENLKITEEKLQFTITQLEMKEQQNITEKLKRDTECEEWKQLHEDLLVAVRVANEIKTDCQSQLEKTQARVKELEEANAALKAQSEKKKREDDLEASGRTDAPKDEQSPGESPHRHPEHSAGPPQGPAFAKVVKAFTASSECQVTD